MHKYISNNPLRKYLDKEEFIWIQKELPLQFVGILGHSTDGDI